MNPAISLVPIPDDSHGIRLFHDERNTLVGPIDCVAILMNYGETCEVALAHGDLTNEFNIMIGIKALKQGYKTLRFYCPKGTRVSRWATFSHSDDLYDYHTIDLKEMVDQYTRSGSK